MFPRSWLTAKAPPSPNLLLPTVAPSLTMSGAVVALKRRRGVDEHVAYPSAYSHYAPPLPLPNPVYPLPPPPEQEEELTREQMERKLRTIAKWIKNLPTDYRDFELPNGLDAARKDVQATPGASSGFRWLLHPVSLLSQGSCTRGHQALSRAGRSPRTVTSPHIPVLVAPAIGWYVGIPRYYNSPQLN